MFSGLAFSVILEILRVGCIQASISAYYYTPSRAIFVGVLMTAGFAMVVVLGRTPSQDLLLNVAGMTAPGIALIPAAFPQIIQNRCGSVDLSFKSEGVSNNGLTYLFMLLLAGCVAVWLSRRGAAGRAQDDSTTGISLGSLQTRNLWLGFAVTCAIGLLGALWFFLDRKSFERHGHLASGGAMFVCVAATAIFAASTSKGRAKFGYWGAVGVIVLGLGLGGGLFVIGNDAWLFWLEALMLVGFAGFWGIQTVESWNENVVPPRRSLADPSRQTRLPAWLWDSSRWPVERSVSRPSASRDR